MKFSSRQQLEVVSRDVARAEFCAQDRSVCRVLGDIKMMVQASDVTMAPHLMLDGFWEPWITTFVQRLVQPGWRVVNVGAAFGYYTLVCAQLGARVLAYEPQSSLARMVQDSIQLNGWLERAKVVNAAVGAVERREAHLFVDPTQVGGATLQPQAREGTYHHPTRIVTLDAAVPDDMRPVDCMIIDTEGHEQEVLRGAERMLDLYPNVTLVMEFTPEWYEDAAGFARALDARFEIRAINNDGLLSEPQAPEFLLRDHQTTAYFGPRGGRS